MPSRHLNAPRPVALLHGWGGSYARTWVDAGWEKGLRARGRRVIGIDLPGHGRSVASRDPGDYADLAGAVGPQLSNQPVDAVGFSLGAKVLLELATRDTTRFGRIVIAGLGSNAFQPEPAGELWAEALLAPTDDRWDATTRALVEYAVASGNDREALAACLRRPANPTLLPERLSAVHNPTLLIAGANDRVAPAIELLAAALPSARVLLIPGVGHLDLPANASFQAAAIAFLEKPERIT